VLIIERIHGVSEVPAMMGVLYIKEQPHLKKEKVLLVHPISTIFEMGRM
jgi:hypothetical protein